ncbi:MAG: PIN domain-containing protein [Dehalococcoidia bacterium]
MLIADTSGLLAVYNREDAHHGSVRAFLERAAERLAVSPFVVGELDYLVMVRAGPTASREVLRDLAGNAFEFCTFDGSDLRSAIKVVERYPDQAIGLTDASLVVLAERFRTLDILTLDYRHFDVLRPLQGGRFRLMPRDWEGA